MNTIIGDGTMTIGGGLRPYYIGTRQTAIFCELQAEGYDLQDYNALLGQILVNQVATRQAVEAAVAEVEAMDLPETDKATSKHHAAQQAAKSYKPQGRKELTPGELRDFVYSALAAGAKREGQYFAFDPDQVGDWIDEADAEEVMKPLSTHIQLLGQRLARQVNRPGNAPAPALKATRGGKQAPKKKKA